MWFGTNNIPVSWMSVKYEAIPYVIILDVLRLMCSMTALDLRQFNIIKYSCFNQICPDSNSNDYWCQPLFIFKKPHITVLKTLFNNMNSVADLFKIDLVLIIWWFCLWIQLCADGLFECDSDRPTCVQKTTVCRWHCTHCYLPATRWTFFVDLLCKVLIILRLNGPHNMELLSIHFSKLQSTLAKTVQ